MCEQDLTSENFFTSDLSEILQQASDQQFLLHLLLA